MRKTVPWWERLTLAAPEQAVSDGQGQVYVDIEDKDQVAVVDANALTVTGRYDLNGRGGGPAGLALDAKNHLLFAGAASHKRW